MKEPREILREIWGHKDFKGSQLQAIEALLKNQDVLALMPTGGGKSLCYQIPALGQEGICIVVSPLIALIQDQVASLKRKGIKAIAIAGGISIDELVQRLDNCIFGGYKFLYLSPERLQQPIVQERIAEMNVNLIAIDEAHCISQWGNDFRPSYLNCSILRELLPNVPMIALTATATKKVVQDIYENLKLSDSLVLRDSFTRKNLVFEVKSVQDKQYQLYRALENETESAIVYVGTRKKTQALSQFLQQKKITSDFFHGGLSHEEKKTKLDKWLQGKIQVIVATNAFGMGIDKSNVRTVIHFRIPDSLENYFQEVGRAGRDGHDSKVLLLTNEEDKVQAKKQYIDMFPDLGVLKALYKNLNNHFQIAYGEGNGATFEFDFTGFCSKYKLNPHRTHNALKLLDQYSVIALSDSFRKKSTAKFLASKEKLFQYLERNSSLVQIVQTMLRTYGGLFDFETTINLKLLSNKATATEKQVLETLQKLKVDGILDCEINPADLSITFLVPREDEKTLYRFSHKIEELVQRKKDQFETMLSYSQNTSECRSVFIMHYFDEEDSKDCGKCDICTNKKTGPSDPLEDIKEELLRLAKKQPKNSRELASLLNIDERRLLPALKELLEDELLTLTQTNAYQIK